MPRRKNESREPIERVRCGIYTRKSHAEGLDSSFNTLDAQRESAENYIASQKHQGWIVLPECYDDGGFTGANMDRPALQRLLLDIQEGRVDCVVLYRVDRLCRSIVDFGKIIEIFDEHDVSFVSVTEQFSTATPTGRLHLNMLLSFAQYEREIIAERIRDKVAAAKRRGKYCGGMPVLGYDVDREAKRLVVNDKEARLVRKIFKQFCDLRSTTLLATELNRQGRRTKQWITVKGKVQGGRPWNKANIYSALHNKKYRGLVEHRGKTYPGEHEAIVPQRLWDQAHRILAENNKLRATRTRSNTTALLQGVIACGHCGCSMTTTYTRKAGRTYRYYLCVHASKNGYAACPVKTVAAGEIEEAVTNQLRAVFRTPELIARTFREAKELEAEELERLRDEQQEESQRFEAARVKAERLVNADAGTVAEELGLTDTDLQQARERLAELRRQIRLLETQSLTEQEVVEALQQIDPVWDELFPAERNRIVQLLVERVEIREDGLEVRLRGDGFRSLVAELGGETTEARAG